MYPLMVRSEGKPVSGAPSSLRTCFAVKCWGEKRPLPGGRTRGCIYRLGSPLQHARRIALCEGYATGLSIDAPLS